jgi:hypothetical protein
MASETLIRQAEKMYGSMADTTDYATMLTQPFVDEMNKNLETQRLKTEALIATMPAGVNISKVPEELQGIVTDYLTENKAAYVEASKVIGSGIKPTDPRYLEAMEKMNQIRGGFEALDANLVKLAENRKLSLDNIDNISPGAGDWNSTLQHKFGNGSIYGELTLRDGNFYYKGEDGNDVNTSDYRLATQQGTAITDNMQKWHVDSRKVGKEGYDFDKGMYRGNIKSLLKKSGKDGRVDFAFSGLYGDESGQTEFIDKWIAEKHGVTDGDEYKLDDGTVVKSNPAEFKRLYASLKNEDFDSKSDIGRALEDYLVNTVEESYNTGVAVKQEQDRKNNLIKYEFDKPEIYGAYRSKKDIDDMNEAIKNKQGFVIGFDNKKYIYNSGTDKYEFGEEVYSPDDLRILQKIHGYKVGEDPTIEVPVFSPTYVTPEGQITKGEGRTEEEELDLQNKISSLDNITEEKSGKVTKRFNYVGDDYEAAAKALATAENAGIDGGFIVFLVNNKEISIDEYRKLKDKSKVTFKVQLGVFKK